MPVRRHGCIPLVLAADGLRLRKHHALCPGAGFARCESEAVAQIQHHSTAVQQQGLEFVSAAMSRAGPQDASWADKLVLQSCLEVGAADRRLHMLGWERLVIVACLLSALASTRAGQGAIPACWSLFTGCGGGSCTRLWLLPGHRGQHDQLCCGAGVSC